LWIRNGEETSKPRAKLVLESKGQEGNKKPLKDNFDYKIEESRF
jgi:hypothetical protein